MITIQDLLRLKAVAERTPPLDGYDWPPSVYYRYIAELVALQKSRVFVELGTCGGGCARHVALRNPQTNVITIDIEEHPNATKFTLDNCQRVIGDSIGMAASLGQKYKGLIDTLFVDTIHEYVHVMNEFNAWRPFLAVGAVVLFDDLNRPGLDRVWKELPGVKTGFNDLKEMHIGGNFDDGGFGALII